MVLVPYLSDLILSCQSLHRYITPGSDIENIRNTSQADVTFFVHVVSLRLCVAVIEQHAAWMARMAANPSK